MLEPKKAFEEIRQTYEKESARKFPNFIIYGDSGCGKTWTLHTAPKPILIDSFDPHGTETLKSLGCIDRGEVLVDRRFEEEDCDSPSAYELWLSTLRARKSKGLFDHIGTYCIDSITTFGDALMNRILQRGTRTGGIPEQRDYQTQQKKLQSMINICSMLPCHFIATGHIDITQDQVTGRTTTRLMVSGKANVKILLMFGEIYVARVEETEKGLKYALLTQNDGRFRARTRIGAGRFDASEEPDISALLKKAGRKVEDKPLFL